MKPQEVMSLIKEQSVKAVDLRFVDLPGMWQHFTVSTKEFSADVFDEGIGFDGSSIRGFQAIQESDMLLFPDPDSAFLDPFTAVPTLVMICDVRDPVTGEAYSRDPRYIATKAERYLKSTGHRRHRVLRPRARVLHLRRRPLRPVLQLRLLLPRRRRGLLEQRQGREAEPGLQAALQGRLLPGAADRQPPGHPHRDDDDAGVDRRPRRGAPPRGGDRGPGRDRHAVRLAAEHGRQAAQVQVRDQERRAPARQDRDADAQAAVQDNGSGMHVHQSLWKGKKNLFFEGGTYADLSQDGALLHRRHPEARAGAARVLRADHQLVPPPGARLRSADQPHLLAAQPVGRGAHPRLLAQREVEAHRGAVPRSGGQRLPRVQRAC